MKKAFIYLFFLVFFAQNAAAQTPVEVFVGHKRTTLDVLWFRSFKQKDGTNSPFLMFQRNRVSAESDTKPPIFGSTSAVSYSFRKSGIGLVAVGQFLGTGFTPKMGVQFFKHWKKPSLTIFTWVVEELKETPNTDWFLLARAEPKISGEWRAFSQVELFEVTNWHKNYSLTQRLRLGLGYHEWQFGIGSDFSQQHFSGAWLKIRNFGGFVRHVF